MALEIVTVGAKVATAWETTAGTRPSTGFTELPDVNQAPEFDLSIDTIDVSNITDYITRYKKGRQDPGGDVSFTLNHTNAVITAWNTLCTTAATNYPLGKRLWFAYVFPDASDAFYWAGEPAALGSGGISQNVLNTIPAHCAVNEVYGWAAAPTITTA